MSTRTVGVLVNVDASTNGASGKLRAFGGVAKGAAAGAAALAAVAVVAGAKLYEIGDRADDANSSIRLGVKSMDLFGKATGKVADRLIDYANKQAIANGVDQNTIKATQAKLLVYDKVASSADKMGGNFDRATLAAVDLAAKGFGSAESNAAKLGKVLNAPAEGLASLARLGVKFTDQEKARIETLVESNRVTEAQAIILDRVERRVGGTAAAMSGGVDRLKIRLSQAAETIGLKFVPIADKAADYLSNRVFPAVAETARVLGEKLAPYARKAGQFIKEDVVPALQGFYRWAVEKVVPGIKATLVPVLDGALKAFNKVKGAIDDNSSELSTLGGWLKTVAEFVAEKVGPLYGKYLKKQFENAGTAIGFIIDTIGFLVRALQSAYDIAQKVIDAISRVIDLAGNVGGAVGGALSNIPGLGFLGRTTATPAAPPAAAAPTTLIQVNVDGSGILDENYLGARLVEVLQGFALRNGQSVILGGAA